MNKRTVLTRRRSGTHRESSRHTLSGSHKRSYLAKGSGPHRRSDPQRQSDPRKGLDLSVQLGSLELRNPVMIASGLAGYGDDLDGIVNLSKMGAVVTKTLTLNACEGNAPPRLVETPSGLMNSIGLANLGCRAFISQRLDRLKTLKTKIIVSVGGFSEHEYGEVVLGLEEVGGFDGFEVNISCPNVKEGGMSFGSSPSRAASVVRIIRSQTSKPLIVKLTPNVTDIACIARACVSEGADALTIGNTFKALAVNVQTRGGVLGAGTGGLSGPAIKALSLAKVWEAVSAVSVPVIACGGICCANDALEFIIAGATAFQVGSACLRNFKTPELVLAGISEYFRNNRIRSIAEIRGTLKSAGL
jgi:dihydroorotate dehydrogenase (NAD+) catalytic subunit